MNDPLYKKWDIVEILPPEDCDTSHWPWYTLNMIETFSKNPKVEIIYAEIHDYQPLWWDRIYYYQYRVRDCHWDWRYVNEDWIKPKSTIALFI